MRISRRLSDLVQGGGDGWGLYYRARAMIEAGEPVTMLTIGDPDVGTDPRIVEALADSARGGNLGYAPVEGTLALRRAIAERVTARTATPATPEAVAVMAGGQAGLFAALTAALDPGESCVLLDPCYTTYPQTVRAVSGRPITVPTPADQGFQPDVAAIEAALAPDTRAILINTPNNPTGAVYAPERLAALADLCRARDLWLISDEVYDTQVWEGAHLSPRDLPGMAERTLVINSLSKSHAMTGSRLGWVIGPETVIEHLWDLSTATIYGQPGYIQDAAVFALAAPEIEAAAVARYRDRRAAALAALDGAQGLRVVPSQGAMYLMLDVRRTGLSGTAFAERLLEAEGIAVMPGESFGQAAAGHLRVALTRPEEVLVPALERLAAFADARARKAHAAE